MRPFETEGQHWQQTAHVGSEFEWMEISSMRPDFRAMIVLIALFFLLGNSAPAQEPTKEIQLTARLIEAYLLTQPAVTAIQLKVWKGEVKADDPGFIADL